MELPLVLCGPILRRVEPERACVWLATRDDVPVRGALTDAAGYDVATSDPERGGREHHVHLGANLHVHLLEMRPPASTILPRDQLLLYDVDVDGNGLASETLRAQTGDLAYGDLGTPSFVLPTALSRILHASCRKPHAVMPTDHAGPLDPPADRLALGDRLLAADPTDPAARPGALFLTGDQIYADTVGAPLLPWLVDAADALMGGGEILPNVRDDERRLLFYREKFVDAARFTTGSGDNHLLSFGEFAAMYLAVWGGLSVDLPKWTDVQDRILASAYERAALEQRFESERAAILAFRETLPAVRRFLANVPTYTIFDDHEVTDDWNLNRAWVRRVSREPLGRRVVANGLAAYFAFQSWGNYPERHTSRLIDAISVHLLERGRDPVAAERFEQRLWNVRGWGYSVPTSPPTLVVDTRTQREFDSPKGAARLVDRYDLGFLRTAWSDLKQHVGWSPNEREQPLILVSATPVYGFDPVERLQALAMAVGWKPEEFDFESWIANRDGFGILMRTLTLEMRPRWVLVLSGDVHYSFTSVARFEVKGSRLSVLQATSSPARNFAKETPLLERFSELTKLERRRFGWSEPEETPWRWRLLRPLIELAVRMGWRDPDTAVRPLWKDRVEFLRPEGSERVVSDANNLGMVRFENGYPVTHELLIPDGDGCEAVTFRFPPEEGRSA